MVKALCTPGAWAFSTVIGSIKFRLDNVRAIVQRTASTSCGQLIDHTTERHRSLAERSVHLRSRRPDLTALVAVLLKATERFG